MAHGDYFENPTTGYKQYRASFLGAQIEYGIWSFTTTGLTVEVDTYFDKILAGGVISAVTTNENEQFYCDLVIDGGGGAAGTGYTTVSRVLPTIYREFHFPLDEGQISANDYADVPLMIAQAAMTLTQLEFFKGTAFGGGTVIMNLGSNADDGKYLEDISVTKTAASTDTVTSFTSGTAAVADGDDIWFETEGGTTSGPADGVVSIKATETKTATSGLTFSYFFIGLH